MNSYCVQQRQDRIKKTCFGLADLQIYVYHCTGIYLKFINRLPFNFSINLIYFNLLYHAHFSPVHSLCCHCSNFLSKISLCCQ